MYKTIEDTVGNTPIVQLQRLPGSTTNFDCDIIYSNGTFVRFPAHRSANGVADSSCGSSATCCRPCRTGLPRRRQRRQRPGGAATRLPAPLPPRSCGLQRGAPAAAHTAWDVDPDPACDIRVRRDGQTARTRVDGGQRRRIGTVATPGTSRPDHEQRGRRIDRQRSVARSRCAVVPALSTVTLGRHFPLRFCRPPVLAAARRFRRASGP